jgi:hypothetical protein
VFKDNGTGDCTSGLATNSLVPVTLWKQKVPLASGARRTSFRPPELSDEQRLLVCYRPGARLAGTP